MTRKPGADGSSQYAVTKPTASAVPGNLQRSAHAEVARADASHARAPLVARGRLNGAVVFEIELNPEKVYTISRSSSDGLRFDDDAVSRTHGTLRHRIGEGWIYTDAGSTNGTILFLPAHFASTPDEGDTFHGRSVRVALGDVLGIGTQRCRLELVDAVTRPRPKPAPSTLVSRAARRFDEQLTHAASSGKPTFLLGASGTGKTHAAAEIHRRSRRRAASPR